MKSLLIPKLNLQGKSLNITVPSSKSIANRALILAALSKGTFRIKGDFEAEDIQLMIEALRKLGMRIKGNKGNNGNKGNKELEIENNLSWRENEKPLELFVGNSGTCMRFLTALVSLRTGETVLTGKQRMKERPIHDLVDALRQIGVQVEYLEKEGFPPVKVIGKGIVQGKKAFVKGNISSQFLTALLLVGSAFEEGLEIEIKGEMVSRPYVEMTVDLLRRSGVPIEKKGSVFRVMPCVLKGSDYEVEGDASAAVYWWALGFLHGAMMTIDNLPKSSHQPDAKFLQVMKYLNKHSPCAGNYYDLDMNDMPDSSLMLMALAPLLDYPIMIRGLGSLRVKETDRLTAMATELEKLGIHVQIGQDWMSIEPLDLKNYKFDKIVQIDTYDDHRIAMSFAILGTKLGNLEIMNPDCVKKTYPGFWKELRKL